MTARKQKPLGPPTIEERRIAGEAARTLQAAITGQIDMGQRAVMFLDLSKPRRGECHETWANVPGFSRVNGRYRHACLPGWEYARAEIKIEMIPDLEALAERGIRPAAATSGGNS